MATANNKKIVTFSKPHSFEGKEYKEVDLSGIDKVTGEDLMQVEEILSTSGVFTPMPEASLSFCYHLAAKASDKPIEFYKTLPARDAFLLKNSVMAFLNN